MRCWWVGTDPEYLRYHDEEWGWPAPHDNVRLYEKICLEGFQAGLSWITILRKRENFRRAFAGFDFEKVALFTDKDVNRLLQDAGIIRHRGKIEAAINNAARTCELVKEFGSLHAYFQNFKPDAQNRPEHLTYEIFKNMTQSPESIALSKDLKKRGFKFVGPTTLYAHMQAMGMVNDHLDGCCIREKIERLKNKTD